MKPSVTTIKSAAVARKTRSVRSSQSALFMTVFVTLIAISAPSFGATKKPLPDTVRLAKSIYLESDDRNQAVLDAASDEFRKWGRFSITDSRDQADLIIRFAGKRGIDKWGNAGFISTDVFLKGNPESVFEAKSAVHIIGKPQHRTISCIKDFKNQLEGKP